MVEFTDIPAKLLLFGEFSVLKGSSALTLPLYDYSAKLTLPSGKVKSDTFSNTHLKNFLQYLQSINFEGHIDLQRLRDYINKGLYLKSDIPSGYGLGSSASLCVAVYNSFGISDKKNPEDLRVLYGQMESFFHGKSSGIDPLAIHFEKMLLARRGAVEFIEKEKLLFFRDIHIYLLDTGISRNSAQTIGYFKESMEDLSYYNNFKSDYLPLLEQIIDNIVCNKPYWDMLLDFSKMQFACFRKMIPDYITKIWLEGLENREVCFKLLGAGGGGFLLVFSKRELSETELGWKLKKLSF